jgi:hypothetical protein
MSDFLIRKGELAFGAIHYPDRKHPALCIEHGNQSNVYGYFRSDELAHEFMSAVAYMIGAKQEEE